MATGSKTRRNLALALAFLGPNIIGFLGFTLIPLVLSLILAFSNWDLRLHNMFKDEAIKFVGLGNFVRLLSRPEFFRFLGNTLFFMMGIPFSIAGSLILALLLSKDIGGGSRRIRLTLLAGAGLVVGCIMLAIVGAGATAMTILLVGLVGGLLIAGVATGSTVYRTLFYLPSFTAGVAVYILWKKLYNPNTGPVNTFLAGPIQSLSAAVHATPAWVVHGGTWLCVAFVALLVILGIRRLRTMWIDGDLGWMAGIVAMGFLSLPVVFAQRWWDNNDAALALAVVVVAWAAWQLKRFLGRRDFRCGAWDGFAPAAMFAVGLMVLEFVLVGGGIVFSRLPQMVLQGGPAGLATPGWLTNYYWAKPAIMIMGFWAAIGSNNMLLYLAGISNVPQDLYEAADIDGASRLQKFWNITWIQLAPTTFFIVIMSVIGGLQGGFEMARTMTKGGPAGATTTLSYFIYTEGFETGRLGFSSAVAWTLFALVFVITTFNWKFGNRYVND